MCWNIQKWVHSALGNHVYVSIVNLTFLIYKSNNFLLKRNKHSFHFIKNSMPFVGDHFLIMFNEDEPRHKPDVIIKRNGENTQDNCCIMN